MPKFFKLADAMLVSLKKDPVFSMTIPGKIQSYLRNAKPILSALDGAGAVVIDESGAGVNVNSEDFLELAKGALKMSKLSAKDLNVMSDNAKKYYNENFELEALLSQFEIEVECECSRIKSI
jgi:hypothetical protein